jgi:hypothetical protein
VANSFGSHHDVFPVPESFRSTDRKQSNLRPLHQRSPFFVSESLDELGQTLFRRLLLEVTSSINRRRASGFADGCETVVSNAR